MRSFDEHSFTDADLLAAAARTTVCVEQEANRERQLAAELGAQALRCRPSAGRENFYNIGAIILIKKIILNII